jgi:hypothetical protein
MTLSALGIFSAAGASVGPVSGFQLISTTILGSSQAAVSFDVTGLGSTYRHLQIRSAERNSQAVVEAGGVITINGSNGVETHFFGGTGSTVFTGRDEPLLMFGLGANAAANNFAPRVLDLFDAFNTTKNKTIVHSWGTVDPGLNRGGFYQSGLWENTAAVTSITYTSNSNFVAGSRFSIYGIRG